MENTLYQNIDTPIINPLPPPKKTNFTIPLIIITLVTIIILTTLSLVKKTVSPKPVEIIIPTSTPIPTIINQPNQIPTQYLMQFNEIDLVKNDTQEILPPTIDPNIIP